MANNTVYSHTGHYPDDVPKEVQSSLDRLGLDYIDLFLMHWPMAKDPASE
jgi:diketogulonate reductase-like aldo/keto reductase